ncbi:matrixin family metalloprotease [Candidatus Pacearchaeota archaeon]|nr:matrixin family metalloprotease [Candidatus Pacearchaeota archaeon]
MKKTALLVLFLAVLSISLVMAFPNLLIADVALSNGHASVVIPENAVEAAPGVFDLGSAVDVTGEVVHGYMIVHYKKGYEKPPVIGGSNGGALLSSCYSFLAAKARWKITEPYLINPSNTQGLLESFIVSSAVAADEQWDNQVSFNIFGNNYVNYSATYNNGALDGVNTLSFGDISEPGVIAVTNVWGIFGGNPANRKLVEWDMLLDQNDFAWGDATADASKMDLQNIITHEIGHAAGMGHPSDSCTEETMYRFASTGETKKRDLNSGDITGIKKLYG